MIKRVWALGFSTALIGIAGILVCIQTTTSQAQPQDQSMHFRIPHGIRGHAVTYLEKYPIGKVDRALTALERAELKALFLWAARHDNPKFGSPYHYIDLKAPLYRLLATEYPGAGCCFEEWGEAAIENIAYVLMHNLTPKEVFAWRRRQYDKIMMTGIPRHLPDYGFPPNAMDHEFDVSNYVSTYPVRNTEERMDEADKQKLLWFLAKADVLEKRKDLRGVITIDCPVMRLVRTNYPRTRSLQPIGNTCLFLKDILAAMKHP